MCRTEWTIKYQKGRSTVSGLKEGQTGVCMRLEKEKTNWYINSSNIGPIEKPLLKWVGSPTD